MDIPTHLLAQLAEALQRPPATKAASFPQKLWSNVAANGWAARYELEDLVQLMDRRCCNVDLEALAIATGYPFRMTRYRPRFAFAEYMVHDMMAVADVAGFCILLEQLGFTVNPEPMIATLSPQLGKQPIMTMAEGDVVVYHLLRERTRIALYAQGNFSGWPEEKAWRNDYRYRYRVLLRDGHATSLIVTGPRYRRKNHIPTTCAICGYTYTRGDPESAMGHRTEHARVSRLLFPRSTKPMRRRMQAGQQGERVDANAPLWLHREVYERAVRFKRDFGYDFIQWPDVSTRAKLDPRWVGFVFVDDEGAIDGACAFMREKEGGWALHWVWIRPDKRRAGILAARWPAFLAEFGDFWIEHPLSPAMLGFVERHASPGQRQRIAGLYPSGSPVEHPRRAH